MHTNQPWFPPRPPKQQSPSYSHIPSPKTSWFQPLMHHQPFPPSLQFWESQGHNLPESGSRAPAQHYQGSLCGISPAYQQIAQQYQYQQMAQQYQYQQWAQHYQYWQMAQQYQYEPPSSGPYRDRHIKGRKKRTEAPKPYQRPHVSSGAVTRDRPTGIHPVHARMDAFYNTRAGGVRRPPSGNPTMGHHDMSRDMRVKPYKGERTDKVDPSVYKIPIAAPERDATRDGPNIPSPTSALAAPSRNTTSKERTERVEDDDFDTISLGSDTDDGL